MKSKLENFAADDFRPRFPGSFGGRPAGAEAELNETMVGG